MKERLLVGERTWEGELPRQEVQRLPDGSLRVRVGDRTWTAWVDGDHVCIGGRVRRVRRAPPSATTPPPVVTPPMPAVVGRILVALGEVVVEGQGLVTVIAMKMEMTLRAPRAGVVASIHVAPGDRVGPGDVLVEVT